MQYRTKITLLLAVVAVGSLVFTAAAGKENPARPPRPDQKGPDTSKPVKVYILAGQSNMLEMGNVSGGNSRHSSFYQSADADAAKGVAVSVYQGKYDPDADYDKLTPTTTKTVIYDGMGTDPFPKVDGQATYVARGFIEVKTTGVYVFSPGYGDSTCNITELEGKEPMLPIMIATVGFGGHEMSGNTKTVWEAQMAVGDPEMYPELVGTVITVDTRDFWRSKKESPSGQGYHYNRNAETYILVGETLGRGMIKLLAQSKR